MATQHPWNETLFPRGSRENNSNLERNASRVRANLARFAFHALHLAHPMTPATAGLTAPDIARRRARRPKGKWSSNVQAATCAGSMSDLDRHSERYLETEVRDVPKES